MIRGLLVLAVSGMFLSAVLADQPVRPTPLVQTLTPSTAQAGAELVAAGRNLGKEFVAGVYLTQGDSTYDAKVTGQTAETITFVVPANLKAGRFGVMVLTKGEVPRYIDEPVWLNIE